MAFNVYPLSADIPVTVNGETIPVCGDTVPPSSTIANLLRQGKLLTRDPWASNKEQRAESIDDPLSDVYTDIPKMLHIAQGAFFSASVKAAESQSTVGPITALYTPPQDFSQYLPDLQTLPGYAANWFNCTFTNVVAREKAALRAWLDEYIAAGGRAFTHVAIDQENLPSWYALNGRGGVPNASAIFDNTPFFQEYFGYSTYAAWIASLIFPADLYWFLSWNNAATACVSKALDEAYTEVLQSYWPDVEVSFYGFQHITKEKANLVPYLTGFGDWYDTHPGTHTAPEMYGWTNNGGVWGDRNFDVMIWEIARLRAQKQSFPATKIAPWVPFADYVAVSVTGTGYSHTAEKVYHCFLAGCSRVLYFNPNPPFGGSADADAYMQQVMVDIRGRFSNREVTPLTNGTLPTSATHNTEYFVSGAQVGGEYLWRISVSEKVKNVTVNGTVLARNPTEFGLWVKTATSTAPTVAVSLENGPL